MFRKIKKEKEAAAEIIFRQPALTQEEVFLPKNKNKGKENLSDSKQNEIQQVTIPQLDQKPSIQNQPPEMIYAQAPLSWADIFLPKQETDARNLAYIDQLKNNEIIIIKKEESFICTGNDEINFMEVVEEENIIYRQPPITLEELFSPKKDIAEQTYQSQKFKSEFIPKNEPNPRPTRSNEPEEIYVEPPLTQEDLFLPKKKFNQSMLINNFKNSIKDEPNISVPIEIETQKLCP